MNGSARNWRVCEPSRNAATGCSHGHQPNGGLGKFREIIAAVFRTIARDRLSWERHGLGLLSSGSYFVLNTHRLSQTLRLADLWESDFVVRSAKKE